MPWSHGPLVVFHGTDNLSATAIRLKGIDPASFRIKTDFGGGFYTTTVFHQAKQWANQRCRRSHGVMNAEVLQYDLDRDHLEKLRQLSFTLDNTDYYEFVAYCRAGYANHGPAPRRVPYDLVSGPVSLWPQMLTIADCDQLLFTRPSMIAGFALPSCSHVPPSSQKFF